MQKSKLPVVVFLALMLAAPSASAAREGAPTYEPSAAHPYGRPNPTAPPELAQFDFMVGRNDCSEEYRNATGNWEPGKRTWDAHYYMNGFAIADTGRSATQSNGNIRIFDTATKQWVVTFFAMPTFGTGVWRGGKAGANIVLKNPQKAPSSGLDGVSRLTFSNISAAGFDWIGEWVADDGSMIYPFWKISCKRVQ